MNRHDANPPEADIDLDRPEYELVLRDTGSYVTSAGVRDVRDLAG